MRAFLGLGSNLGDRFRYLRDAIDSLTGVVAVSSVYESEPVGGPHDQGPYLNVVVELDTDLSPRELLGVCQRLESGAGRVRGERWGPRTLDVDILWMDGVHVDEPDLVIPHPRMTGRRFVLQPLGELAPELLPPGWDLQVAGAVRRLATLDEYERHLGDEGWNVEGRPVGKDAGQTASDRTGAGREVAGPSP